jgi:Uma2 family endonuclease
MAVAISDARRLTREEYERLVKEGFFDPDARIELIHGRLVEMAPQTTFHSVGINLAQVELGRVFGEGFAIRVQLPLAIDPDSEPEPDVVVAPGNPRDYLAGHPTFAALVVEVAETSLLSDRNEKAGLYAQAGIPEYWLLNLVKACLEVYRDPRNGEYQSRAVLLPGDFISPLARPEAQVAVADLLPLLRR